MVHYAINFCQAVDDCDPDENFLQAIERIGNSITVEGLLKTRDSFREVADLLEKIAEKRIESK